MISDLRKKKIIIFCNSEVQHFAYINREEFLDTLNFDRVLLLSKHYSFKI